MKKDESEVYKEPDQSKLFDELNEESGKGSTFKPYFGNRFFRPQCTARYIDYNKPPYVNDGDSVGNSNCRSCDDAIAHLDKLDNAHISTLTVGLEFGFIPGCFRKGAFFGTKKQDLKPAEAKEIIKEFQRRYTK